MPNLRTIADWAKSMNISRQQGYAAVERCAIPVVDGKLDPDVAGVLYKKHTRARANGKSGANHAGAADAAGAAGGGGAAGAVAGYDTSRARREEAEAAIAEMKLAEMMGKYLVKEDVAASVFEIARALRDGLTNSARRIAADVAGLARAEDCEAVIDREHRALLESMTQAISVKLGSSEFDEGGAK